MGTAEFPCIKVVLGYISALFWTKKSLKVQFMVLVFMMCWLWAAKLSKKQEGE